MRVSELLARYLPRDVYHAGGVSIATIDKPSQLLQYDPHFVMFVEAFLPWALNELQKNNPPLSITPAGP